jgi:hypothetical protein
MMLSSKWAAEFIDELADLKVQGYPYNWAWELALERHPPTSRDRREDQGLKFMARITSDAWHGRRPALAQLPSVLELAFDADVAVSTTRLRDGRQRITRIVA